MIRCEVIEEFTLARFDELKNIKRISVDEKGKLFVGDSFDCSEEMAKYLMGENPKEKTVVKAIGVEPKIDEKEEKVYNKPIKKGEKKNGKKEIR